MLVSDEAAWEALWKEHAGEGIEKTAHGFAVWPKVDFHRCMVLAVFSGKETNGAGWRVLSAGERDRQTVIRVDWAGFQTSAPPGQRDLGVPTTGYGIGVVPRSALPVVVEENAQGLKDHPARWRELARLAAAPLPAP
ncbi:MAG: hypothetical protein FJ255_06065 [Phycisphaerae bacterium]|nr:hypothetical protein [Phycisphaerae bacterium]